MKDELVAEGLLTSGLGRGGSILLPGAVEAEIEEAAPLAVRAKATRSNGNGGDLGFEAELFRAAGQAARRTWSRRTTSMSRSA